MLIGLYSIVEMISIDSLGKGGIFGSLTGESAANSTG
jgi:hypothetical protein